MKLIDVVVGNWKIVWGFESLAVLPARFGAILPSQLNCLFSRSGLLHGELVWHRVDEGASNAEMGFFLRRG